jgi:N-acetylglucosaminyldiphosphoundecaprenol N-acetyl-beta-D-mannosaminyltransferase
LSVFMFGGNHGVAARACERIAADSVGLSCVGALEPPVGSAEELSQHTIIDTINSSGADFLVLSLGARKAHEWIERNQWQLAPPVISHLGAVVKYTALDVARAPRWVQRLGLEWLWRVKEEPFLWRRYLSDGFIVGKMLLTHTLPMALRDWAQRSGRSQTLRDTTQASVSLTSAAGSQTLRLVGAWTEANSGPLRLAMARAVVVPGDLRLDLAAVHSMDSAVVALLLLLRGHCLRCGVGLELVNVTAAVQRSLSLYGADYLLEPVTTRGASPSMTADSTWLAPQFPPRIERAD